jgi:hypothetical protein
MAAGACASSTGVEEEGEKVQHGGGAAEEEEGGGALPALAAHRNGTREIRVSASAPASPCDATRRYHAEGERARDAGSDEGNGVHELMLSQEGGEAEVETEGLAE